MSNTLTGLIPTLYEALDIISRELVGFIPSVAMDASADQAAVDQTIRIAIAPASTAAAVTPAVSAPDTGDQTIGYVDMAITDSYMVPVRWNGEEQKSVRGIYSNVLRDQFVQAMRVLANTVEAAIGTAAYQGASRAFGTSATTPFASSLEEAAEIDKILTDNGAPPSDRSLIIDTTAGVNLRTLANLSTVNASGTSATLRQGVLLPLFNMDIRESGQVQTHTAGTATGFDCTAIEPVGETTIAVDGSDSGTILIGDYVVWGATDTNKYMIQSATASGAADGNIVISNPGLRQATAIADEGVLGTAYTANVAFHKNAVQLLARVPAMPESGDMADDVITITDPISGLSFQVAQYRQYRQVHYEVGLAWGVKAIKQEHIAVLLG